MSVCFRLARRLAERSVTGCGSCAVAACTNDIIYTPHGLRMKRVTGYNQDFNNVRDIFNIISCLFQAKKYYAFAINSLITE